MASTTDPSSLTQHTRDGTPFIPLQTKSSTPIFLTPLFHSDAQANTDLMCIHSINMALISPPFPYTLADGEWWVNHVITGQADLPLCAIRAGAPDASGRFIGGCGLAPHDISGFYHLEGRRPEGGKDGENRNVDIGYSIHTDFRGMGIIRPAVRAVVEWGRRECGVGDVRLRVADGNAGSRAVVEGMREFLLVEEEDKWETWPESKGGERRRVFSWLWKG